MKRALCLLAAIFMLSPFGASAWAEKAAGIVLYFESGGEVYLLVAEHASGARGWAAFGGGAREGESPAENAAHKGEDESRGFYKLADLLERIGDQEPVMDGTFASYFAKVDFAPAPSIQRHPVPDDSDAYTERSAFAWIPYSSIAPYLEEDIDRDKKYAVDPAFLPVGSRTHWYWPIWLSNMRQAVVDGALPWEKD